ncbi:MAG: hypothetical protein HFJ47_01665 [Clostridia bacterium]|nr:hypothetical protein [Clostridia bacterium]
MIVEQINKFKNRDKIPKYTREIKEEIKSNILKAKIIGRYQYILCDYCGDEIRLDIKREDRTGGTHTFQHSFTKCGKIELALCNKCLKKVIKEFEEKNSNEK